MSPYPPPGRRQETDETSFKDFTLYLNSNDGQCQFPGREQDRATFCSSRDSLGDLGR